MPDGRTTTVDMHNADANRIKNALRSFADVNVQLNAGTRGPAFTYIGCFVDDESDRDMVAGPAGMNPGFTPFSCAKACEDYTYFAIQDGDRCRCGQQFQRKGKYTKVSDSECNSCSSGEGLCFVLFQIRTFFLSSFLIYVEVFV